MAGMISAKKGLLRSERIKPTAGATIGLRDARSLRGKKAGYIDRSKRIESLTGILKGAVLLDRSITSRNFFLKFEFEA
jgi:hypothetical protein